VISNPIFLPLFAMILWTFAAAVYVLRIRTLSVKSGKVSFKYFKTYDSEVPPREIAQTNRHITNLFEVPVLFYAVCAVVLASNYESILILVLAWGFVASRVAHSIIHLGQNKILPRMITFFVGVLIVLGMWIELLIAHLNA
tara:strand:+ start:171 stop:593 length:423 start_codon:yes stop_codon:yes gene_type:complete